MASNPTPQKTDHDPEFDRDSLRLTRYNLGGIDVHDFESLDKELAGEGEDRKQYVARIHGLMDMLERELNRAMALQAEMTAKYGSNWDMTIYGRGGINVAAVLLERWQQMSVEHQANLKEAQDAQSEAAGQETES